MKTLALLIGALALALIVVNPNALPGRLSTEPAQAKASNASPDPVEALRDLAKDFPTHYHVPPNTDIGVGNVGFDVKKTDSLVNPLTGSIHSCECGIDFRYDFHWKENRWLFVRLVCLENGMDHTNTDGGRERLNSPEFKAFLARCR